jgi:hypothetical protein
MKDVYTITNSTNFYSNDTYVREDGITLLMEARRTTMW